jgi:hypothetical protein
MILSRRRQRQQKHGKLLSREQKKERFLYSSIDSLPPCFIEHDQAEQTVKKLVLEIYVKILAFLHQFLYNKHKNSEKRPERSGQEEVPC